jgi:hypothetical protein
MINYDGGLPTRICYTSGGLARGEPRGNHGFLAWVALRRAEPERAHSDGLAARSTLCLRRRRGTDWPAASWPCGSCMCWLTGELLRADLAAGAGEHSGSRPDATVRDGARRCETMRYDTSLCPPAAARDTVRASEGIGARARSRRAMERVSGSARCQAEHATQPTNRVADQQYEHGAGVPCMWARQCGLAGHLALAPLCCQVVGGLPNLQPGLILDELFSPHLPFTSLFTYPPTAPRARSPGSDVLLSISSASPPRPSHLDPDTKPTRAPDTFTSALAARLAPLAGLEIAETLAAPLNCSCRPRLLSASLVLRCAPCAICASC